MILSVQNIDFSFGGPNGLLNNVTFGLQSRTINLLVGVNGAGKTTLINCICGYYHPKRGRIRFRDRDITYTSPHRIAKAGIGRTFQDLRLVTRLTVRENILLALRGDPTTEWYKALLPLSFYKRRLHTLEAEAEKLLDTYFLTDIADAMAHAISYGQQKLLNLACCVATGAELLLLDEPLAGINPVYRQQILQLIEKLREEGRTILMIEHHPEAMAQLSAGVFFIAGRKIRWYSDYNTFRNDPATIDAYL